LWVPFLLNCIKVIVSTLGGIFTGSLALIADGLDSFGNVISSFFTAFFVKKAIEPPDEEHPYGHVRFEALSAIITFSYMLSMLIILVHTFIERWISGKLFSISEGAPVFALISLTSNIMALWFYKRSGHSGLAVKTEELHIVSDIFEGSAVFVGVLLASMFSPIWDLIAMCIVIFFMGWASVKSFIEIKNSVTDVSPGSDYIRMVNHIVNSVEGVKEVHKIRAKKIGEKIFLDLHVLVDPSMSVKRAHDIADEVLRRIKLELPGTEDVVVHIEPYYEGSGWYLILV